MSRELDLIDDGMMHQAFISKKILVVVKTHRRPLLLKAELPESKGLSGYVAVENHRLVNEGGYQFGQELHNFHGEIVII